jgi:hypothetical protein
MAPTSGPKDRKEKTSWSTGTLRSAKWMKPSQSTVNSWVSREVAPHWTTHRLIYFPQRTSSVQWSSWFFRQKIHALQFMSLFTFQKVSQLFICSLWIPLPSGCCSKVQSLLGERNAEDGSPWSLFFSCGFSGEYCLSMFIHVCGMQLSFVSSHLYFCRPGETNHSSPQVGFGPSSFMAPSPRSRRLRESSLTTL